MEKAAPDLSATDAGVRQRDCSQSGQGQVLHAARVPVQRISGPGSGVGPAGLMWLHRERARLTVCRLPDLPEPPLPLCRDSQL